MPPALVDIAKTFTRCGADTRDETRARRIVSLLALERIFDQTRLSDIASSAYFPSVREAAIDRITDAAILLDLAKSSFWKSRLGPFPAAYRDLPTKAVGRLSTPDQLNDVLNNGRSTQARYKALEKLNPNQTSLSEIATTNSHAGVREKAVSKLTDQPVLARIAVTDSSSGVRAMAVRKLTEVDPFFFAQVADSDRSEDVRHVAADRMLETPANCESTAVAIQHWLDNERPSATSLLVPFEDKKPVRRSWVEDVQKRTSEFVRSGLDSLGVRWNENDDQEPASVVAVHAVVKPLSFDYVGSRTFRAATAAIADVRLTIRDSRGDCIYSHRTTTSGTPAHAIVENYGGSRLVEAVEEETQRAVGKVVAQFASEVLGARGLAVLAKQSGIAQISVAAIRKITDQAMLAEIAKEHEETSVRVAAVEGITDSALLNHLDSLNFRGPDSYKVELAVAGRLLVPRLVEEIRQGKPLKLGTLTGRPSPQDSYAILSLTNTTAHPISFYVQGPGVRKSVTLDNRKIGMGKFVYFQDLPPGLYRIAVKGEPFTGEAITFYGEQRFESGFRYDLKMVKK